MRAAVPSPTRGSRMAESFFPSRFQILEEITSNEAEVVVRAMDEVLEREVFLKRLGYASFKLIAKRQSKPTGSPGLAAKLLRSTVPERLTVPLEPLKSPVPETT